MVPVTDEHIDEIPNIDRAEIVGALVLPKLETPPE